MWVFIRKQCSDQEKAREETNNGVERKKTYTLKTSFNTLHGREIQNFKFREFIEIINMMDEELLGDIANNKKRRKWNDVERLSKSGTTFRVNFISVLPITLRHFLSNFMS